MKKIEVKEIEKISQNIIELSKCRPFKIASFIHNIPTPSENNENVLYKIGINLKSAISNEIIEQEDIKYEILKKLSNDDFKSNYIYDCNWIKYETENVKLNRKFKKIINKNSEKKIIVYPYVVKWEPIQTPQQLLKSFARKNCLCFFCSRAYSDKKIRKIMDNIYSVPEEVFISNIGDIKVNVLVTSAANLPFCLSIKNKTIWYHILDRLDIFYLYGKSFKVCHNWLVKNADIVSYVSRPLVRYCKNRKNIYMPNGCDAYEIKQNISKKIPNDMRPVIKGNKTIIGYYGAVDYWFDFDTVDEFAKENRNINLVIIGPHNIYSKVVTNGIEKLKRNSNVFILGKKKYNELPNYAKFFNIAIIPFLTNDMMNCVSPIKFYEYCTYKIPIISSYMPEIKKFVCDYIGIYKTYSEFCDLVERFMKKEVVEKADEEIKIALENSWDSRTEIIDKYMQ